MKNPRGSAWIWITILFGIIALVGASFWVGNQPQPQQAGTTQAAASIPSENNKAPVATIDQSSLTSNSLNPTLSGTAQNTEELYVSLYANGEKQWGSGNTDVRVVNGKWSVQVAIPCSTPGSTCFYLKPGIYSVSVYGNGHGGGPEIATGTLDTTQASDMSKYTDKKYGFSFSYPNSWRIGDTTLDIGGSFQLFNFTNSTATCGDGCWGPGENKIEATVIGSSYLNFAPDTPQPVTIAGQSAYRVKSDYLSYAILLPAHPGQYLEITMYGDNANFPILEKLIASLSWIQ